MLSDTGWSIPLSLVVFFELNTRMLGQYVLNKNARVLTTCLALYEKTLRDWSCRMSSSVLISSLHVRMQHATRVFYLSWYGFMGRFTPFPRLRHSNSYPAVVQISVVQEALLYATQENLSRHLWSLNNLLSL